MIVETIYSLFSTALVNPLFVILATSCILLTVISFPITNLGYSPIDTGKSRQMKCRLQKTYSSEGVYILDLYNLINNPKVSH